MPEYIEREAMRKVLENASINPRFADEPPTADVAPVVHGRWIRVKWVPCDDPDDGYWIVRCSVCSIPHDKESRFCPHCGAKMDLEEEHE